MIFKAVMTEGVIYIVKNGVYLTLRLEVDLVANRTNDKNKTLLYSRLMK
jgi:hypothetical protein